MIYRTQQRSILKSEYLDTFKEIINERQESFLKDLDRFGLTFVRIFQYESNVFIYAESLEELNNFEWPTQFSDFFHTWPTGFGTQTSRVMLDIFHDAEPQLTQIWRKGKDLVTSVGSIIFLKPEKYSSYVFYHFQLQEEGLRKFNMSYIIGSEGVCLFSYQEQPALLDPLYPRGILETDNSPENWDDVMDEHFQRWEDTPTVRAAWREMKLIMSFENPRK
jgi:hypothetical protein